MFPHPLNNFETHGYYQNETRFNGLYSRNNGWASIINLDKHDDTQTHWIAIHIKNKEAKYFDSFGVFCISKKIQKMIGIKNVIQIFVKHKHLNR